MFGLFSCSVCFFVQFAFLLGLFLLVRGLQRTPSLGHSRPSPGSGILVLSCPWGALVQSNPTSFSVSVLFIRGIEVSFCLFRGLCASSYWEYEVWDRVEMERMWGVRLCEEEECVCVFPQLTEEHGWRGPNYNMTVHCTCSQYLYEMCYNLDLHKLTPLQLLFSPQ